MIFTRVGNICDKANNSRLLSMLYLSNNGAAFSVKYWTMTTIISTHIWCIFILLAELVPWWKRDFSLALKVSCMLFTRTKNFLKSFGFSGLETTILSDPEKNSAAGALSLTFNSASPPQNIVMSCVASLERVNCVRVQIFHQNQRILPNIFLPAEKGPLSHKHWSWLMV